MDKIKIENLELYYGDFHALKTINLDLPANQITALYRTVWLRKVHTFEISQSDERSGGGL